MTFIFKDRLQIELLDSIIFFILSGCPLNKLIDWKWVCRTNTLGWEQCDVLENAKRKRQQLEFPGDDRMPKKY